MAPFLKIELYDEGFPLERGITMWRGDWRDQIWDRLRQPWDVIVVGGGITGAGVLREARRLGLKVLLLEQRDFAWGTSSRSSKLVHGGLRYLFQGDIRMTLASVRERDRLLSEGPGLVDPECFLLASYDGRLPARWIYGLGLSIYDIFSLKWRHRFHKPEAFLSFSPHLSAEGLAGGFSYGDAKADDARLVLRVLREAVAHGGTAFNYARVEGLIRRGSEVVGVVVRDVEADRTAEVFGKVVVNATGAWVGRLSGGGGERLGIRPLRGSHLVLPSSRLPVKKAIAFRHPGDRRRHLFVLPWEGVSVCGTTDLDHKRPLEEEPTIAPEEAAYLLYGLRKGFPSLGLSRADVMSSYAGVRPVVGTGKADPSEESREHVILKGKGLVTVMGGKLTTFRVVALDALRAARDLHPEFPPVNEGTRILDPVSGGGLPGNSPLPEEGRRRLRGRYGGEVFEMVSTARPEEWHPISGTPYLWVELRWAARSEGVVHLDDLLLRRLRLGLLLPGGGALHLDRIGAVCHEELGWDVKRWEKEKSAYLSLCHACYSLPENA